MLKRSSFQSTEVHLAKDGDAAFTLQVAGIHGALGHCLMRLDGARLAQHLVDQCRFAMIDMGDDGEIS